MRAGKFYLPVNLRSIGELPVLDNAVDGNAFCPGRNRGARKPRDAAKTVRLIGQGNPRAAGPYNQTARGNKGTAGNLKTAAPKVILPNVVTVFAEKSPSAVRLPTT